MSRLFQAANLLGICAVVVLYGLQWRAIARIDADRDRLELLRQSQARLIMQQTSTINDQASDLKDFRARLTMAERQLNDLQRKLAAATDQNERLQKSLDLFKAGIAARDAALKNANVVIDSLVTQRDSAIARSNDVVTKYNDLVKKSSQ